MYCLSITDFEPCFIICHDEGPEKPGGFEINWDTTTADVKLQYCSPLFWGLVLPFVQQLL
jgi:hypothetical protein